MDRYEIATGISDRPVAYRFRSSGNPETVYGYLKHCIKEGVMLDASNLKDTVVEHAAMKLCREKKVPFVVATRKEADLLPLVHGYKRVYTVEKLPAEDKAVICGIGVNPRGLGPEKEILLVIMRSSEIKG